MYSVSGFRTVHSKSDFKKGHLQLYRSFETAVLVLLQRTLVYPDPDSGSHRLSVRTNPRIYHQKCFIGNTEVLALSNVKVLKTFNIL